MCYKKLKAKCICKKAKTISKKQKKNSTISKHKLRE